MMKILVTCPPMLRSIDRYRHIFAGKNITLVCPDVVQTLTEQELIQLVPGVDGWIIGDDPATAKVFEAGKTGRLKAAVKWGVGVDNVDFTACERLGIPISNTPRMFGAEVADLAMAYILGLARQSYLIHEAVKQGKWVKPAGISVSGKTIAVVGLGDIGRALTKRLAGFDVRILAYDPFYTGDAASAGADFILPFPEQIQDADILVLTCALTPSSHHMINASSIALMKDGVHIVNVARGPLIREQDLIDALRSGKVGSAALDVFETEPLPMDSPLRTFEKLIFGTHNGSNTVEAVDRASLKAIGLIFEFLKIG
jgi:D-3-phosphoglycerate dehydrogenase / 2-oxoglutarate reductase